MRRLKFIFVVLLSLFAFSPFIGAAAESEGEIDMNAYLFGHVSDSYEWHITTINEKEISIPLPCIIIDEGGLKIFLSNKIEENGYTLNDNGKIVNASTLQRPFDVSITKNVLSLIINALLVAVLILLSARWYKKHDVLKEKPTGIAALLEPVIMMIEDDVIKDAIGSNYKKFSPYLLTAFFFILISNLMGILPIFPGGANLTGNIAVTLVLALFTFFMVNAFGNKHYYKDIFWPDVPIPLKAFPLMPFIEIVGVFTKPLSLTIRLFANIFAGHIMLLGTIGMIFLTVKMGALLNGSITVVAVFFGIFLDCLELLVAFIQAYVFTMLSAVFIGMAQQQPETENQ